MRITFAWWNTSLSPLGKQRATNQQMNVAAEVVRYLTQTLHVDFLALGEIANDDVGFFRSKVDPDQYDYYDGTLTEGRLKFDVGALYKRNELLLVDTEPITNKRGTRSIKLAIRLDIVISGSGSLLHVYVSHWPSRRTYEPHGEDRHVLGRSMRQIVEELQEEYEVQPYIVLLGDYNDEPFDVSLSGQLLATRDRRLLSKDPSMLYNPFWRLLGEQYPYVPGESSHGHCGSYFYAKGLETLWHTFDQIIFSSAFLGRNEWRLLEEQTAIIQPNVLSNYILSNKEVFDHLPIISVIERED